MSEMKCDVCSVSLTSWSARFGGKETTFCKNCFETEEAESVVASKVVTRRTNAVPEVVVEKPNSAKTEVVIADCNMPFISMVMFMVKWAIASIPAMIILLFAFSTLTLFFGGVFR